MSANLALTIPDPQERNRREADVPFLRVRKGFGGAAPHRVRRTQRPCAVSAGMEPVIPPKKNRKEQRDYDKYLYKLRHLVENCFLSLKRWRGIATRYAKTSDAFIAAVHVRCIAIGAAIRA